MASSKQEQHALVSYFVKQYKNKYTFDPSVNRYKALWGFAAVLMDKSVEETKSLIDYYLTTASSNGHDLEWFFYNYDKLAITKAKYDDDAASLARIRGETKRRTEEWRKRVGNNRTESP